VQQLRFFDTSLNRSQALLSALNNQAEPSLLELTIVPNLSFFETSFTSLGLGIPQSQLFSSNCQLGLRVSSKC